MFFCPQTRAHNPEVWYYIATCGSTLWGVSVGNATPRCARHTGEFLLPKNLAETFGAPHLWYNVGMGTEWHRQPVLKIY